LRVANKCHSPKVVATGQLATCNLPTCNCHTGRTGSASISAYLHLCYLWLHQQQPTVASRGKGQRYDGADSASLIFNLCKRLLNKFPFLFILLLLPCICILKIGQESWSLSLTRLTWQFPIPITLARATLREMSRTKIKFDLKIVCMYS